MISTASFDHLSPTAESAAQADAAAWEVSHLGGVAPESFRGLLLLAFGRGFSLSDSTRDIPSNHSPISLDRLPVCLHGCGRGIETIEVTGNVHTTRHPGKERAIPSEEICVELAHVA